MGWWERLRASWRAHKYSFLVSSFLTILGLALYAHTYLAASLSPLAQLVESLEVRTFDTRFRVRGRTEPAPEILIVAIDQATLERIGSWPFSRLHYARLLDRLAGEGARVVAFDINFPRPDARSGLEAVEKARAEYLATTDGRADRAYLARLDALALEADSDARLAEAIGRAGNVVLGYFFFPSRTEVRFVDEAAQREADSLLAFSAYSTRALPDERGATPPPLPETYSGPEGYLAETNLPSLTEAAALSVGFFNFEADADGVFRRAPLAMAYRAGWQNQIGAQANFYPSLDVQVLRRYLDVPEHEAFLLYNKAGVEGIQLGEQVIPTDPQGRMLIHYQGGPFTYPQVSLADVVDGRFAPGSFRDKIVLVGPTALAIGDLRPTPFAESYHAGVEIHANVLDTMLRGRFVHRGDREKMIDLGLIVFFGLGVGLLLATVRPAWGTPVTLVLLAAFLGGAYIALVQAQVWLNVVVPGTVLAANFAGVTAVRVLVEEREKRKVRAAFQQYVAPAVIRELMKSPERLQLGGEERELTIMFSDIRGFTSLSEQLSPLALTRFLNAYTDEMTDIIFRHWGTLDKFEGDAVMAFWGAPREQDDHALRACGAALEMAARVDELRQQWRARGQGDTNIGVGLNTGPVVVGNMGSRKRFNYTVLGDAVNLASRLEGVNKEYTTRLLVSEFTYQQASDPLGIVERRVEKQFGVAREALCAADGSPIVAQARALAVFVAHTQQLAAPRALAERYALGDVSVEPLVTQVEQRLARDKRLQRFVSEALGSLRPYLFRQLDWIRVKGRREPVALYELLGHGHEADRFAELLTLFDTGLQAYRGQQWDAAIEIFERVLEKYPDDGPSHLLADRCRRFRSSPPPADWDGVYLMPTK